jgi:hypothetical protein
MPTKSLDDLRLELQLYDMLPPEVRRMIANADTIPGDIVEATFDALALKGFPKDRVLEIMSDRLTFAKYREGRPKRRR